MDPTVQKLCEAIARTAEEVLLPELQSTYARIQARELAKLARWLGTVAEARAELSRASSAALRQGLGEVAAVLRASSSPQAHALAEAVEGHLATDPAGTALEADAEAGRKLLVESVRLLASLPDPEASRLGQALHTAITRDIAHELTRGLPASSFGELTQADHRQQSGDRPPAGGQPGGE